MLRRDKLFEDGGVSWVFSSCGASVGFLTKYDLETRPDSPGSLECNPEIPAFPGEENEVPDTRLGEVSYAFQSAEWKVVKR